MKFSSMPAVAALSSLLSTVVARLRARRELITITAMVLAALVVSPALGLGAGLLALAAVLAYAAAVAPAEEAAAGGNRQRRTSRSDDAERARQALIDAIPDPAWVLDSGGVVLNANATARDIFPRLRTGISGALAVRSPEVIEAVERALATGALQTAMLHLRVPVERRLTVAVAPLQAEPGPQTAPALLLTLRDLTEQDRLAQMRADFVANASHELRTPLASLRGFVETLQGPARNDAAARDRFLPIMSAQAARMTRLIDDLLSLSRVEMRQHLPPTATVDLAEVAAQAIQALEPQAAQARINLSCEAASRPLLVRGDRDELLQVVQNFVQNGIKYGREGGRVDVRLRLQEAVGAKGPRVELAVVDDGPGIPADHIPRLTERFYRVNAPQSRDKGGTGLGLAIVKHIVSRHGGELQIASKVGKGSSFTVLLDQLSQ